VSACPPENITFPYPIEELHCCYSSIETRKTGKLGGQADTPSGKLPAACHSLPRRPYPAVILSAAVRSETEELQNGFFD
jgi:hypothetical protein